MTKEDELLSLSICKYSSRIPVLRRMSGRWVTTSCPCYSLSSAGQADKIIRFAISLPAWATGQGRMPKSASLLQRDTRSVLTPVCVRSFSVILKSIPKSRMKRGSALFGSWETFPAWSFLPVSLPKAGTFGATRSNARLIFLWRKHHAAAKTHLSS